MLHSRSTSSTCRVSVLILYMLMRSGGLFNFLANMGPRLRRLSLCGPLWEEKDVYVCFQGQHLARLADACPALESFELPGELSGPGILYLMRKCTNLKHLKLKFVDLSSLEEISKMSHRLTSFDLLFFAIGNQAFKMGNGGAGDDVYKLIEKQMEANRARAQIPIPICI